MIVLEVFRGLEVIKKVGVNSADHGVDKRDAEELQVVMKSPLKQGVFGIVEFKCRIPI